MPASTSLVRRWLSTLREMPSRSWNWSKRLTPKKASRRISIDHHSPTTSRHCAIEQCMAAKLLRSMFPILVSCMIEPICPTLGSMTELTTSLARPIAGSTALVTGANRGLGAAYARELLSRGAAKVYAAVRDPATITDPRLIPVQMDLTDRRSIARAASRAQDVTLVINNAGVFTGTATLGDEAGLREELEVNYLGPVAVTRAFAPVIVLSVLSWLSFPGGGGYSSAKAAMWAATNSLRQTLLGQGTLVTAVHVAYIDTEMAASVTAPKISPDVVAAQTLDAVEAGEPELLADDVTRQVRAALSGPLRHLYPP